MAGQERRVELDWRGGGWVLLLTVALVVAVSAWFVVPILRSSSRAIGDGTHVDSYGFDLRNFSLPRQQLAAAGFAKNGIPALLDPPVMPGSAVAGFNAQRRGKYLVSDDRVIGLELRGEARAYPLRVLNWHEVVNDTLGGIPVAVSYHPLCDSVVVFDRRVGDEVLELRVSGLLYNSNLLMYDRRSEPAAESLWSQLLSRAVSGPAEERSLTLAVLPASLVRWDHWLERHPDTTVVAPDPALLKRYERNPYGNYYLTGRPRFPVDPLPPDGSLPFMQRVLVVEQDGRRWIRAIGGEAPDRPGEIPDGLTLTADPDRRSSVIVDGDSSAAVYYCLWFAWYAHHPDAT